MAGIRRIRVGGAIVAVLVWLRSAAGAQATNEFFRLCDAAGSGCAFAGGAAARYAALAARLRAHPAQA